MPEAVGDAKLSAAARRNLKADQFAVPGKKKLPIHDANHIEAAWKELGTTQGLTAEERTEAKKRILAAAKKHGIDTSKWDGVANTDMVVGVPTVLTDSAENDGKLRLRFKVTQSNVVNSNRRLYPDPVIDDAINRSNERIAQNRMVGESPHPKHYVGKDGAVVFDSKLENNVVKWTNQFKDENGVVFADCVVLDTRLGKDLKACVDEGIPVGVSMRALGDSIRKQIGGAMVDVATRLDIHTYDIVMNPATPGCEIVSVLTDSQIEDAMKDGVEITQPACPGCGEPLTAMDPDNDGDLDFYACENCGEAYVPEEDVYVVHQATQRLRSLPNDPDWDGYSLARQWKVANGKDNKTVATDAAAANSTQEGEQEEMDIQAILQAMKDSPEFTDLVNGIAEEKAKLIAQPALDSAAAAAAAAETETKKAEVRTFVDGKVAELKGKIPDEIISTITDSVKDMTDTTTAGVVVDAAVAAYSKAAAQVKLDGQGFSAQSAAETGGNGQVRVTVTNENAPHAQFMNDMAEAFDRVARENGHEIDPSIRKVNKGFVDELTKRYETQVMGDNREAFKDSMTFLDSAIVNNDAVSVGTTQLLNQAVISQLLIIQAFQDVESLQFLASEVFDGDEIRWPVETFTSAAVLNPASGIADLLVGEGVGIPESSINLSWITYNPDWRRNAISLTTDAIKTLKSGPAKYDAVARALYHIAFDKRRKLDLVAYLEMCMASDEYAVKPVASETIAAAQLAAGAGGTNVTYVGSLTVGGTATSTAGSNPVVRPRTKKQHQPGGAVQTVTTNPFTVTVSGTTKTMGGLDATGNITAGADYAVDFENGKVYFAASSGVNPGAATPVLPVVSYSAVTNYVLWHSTVPGGTQADQYYNTLLQLITSQRASMRSAPRFQAPNLGIMSDNVAAFIENAAMWYKFNSPDIGNLSGLADSTFFGSRSGVNLARINAPWAGGDGRILLGQKGATRYGVETPYQIKGPYAKYDNNQQIVDAELYYGRENSVLATPQTVDSTGAILNPKFKTIKIVP